jgi:hypothetical protein
VGFNNGALLIRLNPVQIPARTPRSMGARRRMRWGVLVRNDARNFARARAREATRDTLSRPIIMRVIFLSADENPKDQRELRIAHLYNTSKRLTRELTETVPPEIFEG